MALCLTPIGYVRLKKNKFAPANNNDYKPLSKENFIKHVIVYCNGLATFL